MNSPPLHRVILAASIGSALERFAASWLSLVKAGYSGVLLSLMSELFPTETRGVGVSLSYSISVTLFGGFAPFVATWLIAMTGDSLSPSFYLMFTAGLSIIALMLVRQWTPRQPEAAAAAS